MKFNKLTPTEVEWRLQYGKKGSKYNPYLVPYIKRGAVINAFNSKGMNWGFEYEMTTDGAKGGIYVITNGVKVVRQDFGMNSSFDPKKGAVSDALKRSATLWGFGVELYDYPKVQLLGEYSYLPNNLNKSLEGITIAFNDGKLDNVTVIRFKEKGNGFQSQIIKN